LDEEIQRYKGNRLTRSPSLIQDRKRGSLGESHIYLLLVYRSLTDISSLLFHNDILW
jgi:hypothetical protein